jgi:carboxylesterase type B
MAAYGGRDDKLFHAAIAQSPSFGPVLNIAESQYQYDYLVKRVGCVHARDTLACLRSKPAAEIQRKNINIPYPHGPKGGRRKPKFMWNPVIDDDIVQDHTYRAFREGKFVRVPAIFGDDTNGGTPFVPSATNTTKAFNSFLAAQFPALTSTQLHELDRLYANTSVQFPNRGRYWRQTGTAYGEMRYMCPSLFLSSAMARYQGAKGWNYRYNVQIPRFMEAGFGVPHLAELNAIWGPDILRGNGWKSYMHLNKAIVPVIQAYWLSFIRTYDPNTLRHPGSPEWEEWDPSAQRRLVLQTNRTHMEVVDRDQQERCVYLDSIAIDIQQ